MIKNEEAMKKYLHKKTDDKVKALSLQLKPSLWLIVPRSIKESPFPSKMRNIQENTNEKDIIYGKK